MSVQKKARGRARFAVTVHSWDPTVLSPIGATVGQSKAEGPGLGLDEGPQMVAVEGREVYSGDLIGEGQFRFLQSVRADESANFCGLGRIVGSLLGHAGTFVLQGAGTVDDGHVEGAWFVVPGSGTDELSGLRGDGRFLGEPGQPATGYLDIHFER